MVDLAKLKEGVNLMVKSIKHYESLPTPNDADRRVLYEVAVKIYNEVKPPLTPFEKECLEEAAIALGHKLNNK